MVTGSETPSLKPDSAQVRRHRDGVLVFLAVCAALSGLLVFYAYGQVRGLWATPSWLPDRVPVLTAMMARSFGYRADRLPAGRWSAVVLDDRLREIHRYEFDLVNREIRYNQESRLHRLPPFHWPHPPEPVVYWMRVPHDDESRPGDPMFVLSRAEMADYSHSWAAAEARKVPSGRPSRHP